MTDLLVSPSVSLVNGRPATTSFAIAEHFGKRHDHVVRDIRRLMAELPEEERAPKFGETFRTVAGPKNSERQEVYFTVFFDGFILLAMGYTGKQALQIKLVYIAAFNAMRAELEKKPTPKPKKKLPALPLRSLPRVEQAALPEAADDTGAIDPGAEWERELMRIQVEAERKMGAYLDWVRDIEDQLAGVTRQLFHAVLIKASRGTPLISTHTGLELLHGERHEAMDGIATNAVKMLAHIRHAQWFAKTLRVNW